jgi:DNA-binding transcriptional LysR family regulator
VHATVWATDASADALAVTRANIAGCGRPGGRVRIAEGDWFAALPDDLRGEVDLVVSNPPYVAEGDDLPAEVAGWEPRDALVAGPSGLEHLERIVAGPRRGSAPAARSSSSWRRGRRHRWRSSLGGPASRRPRSASTSPGGSGWWSPSWPSGEPGPEVAIDAAVSALRAGLVVVVPTDTVYGWQPPPRSRARPPPCSG